MSAADVEIEHLGSAVPASHHFLAPQFGLACSIETRRSRHMHVI